MDQTKNNLDRIRAFDAEEGEWRTINGAHVLIKNGRIAGGAGGALNGQPFRGGSLKKMQAGSKGVNSDVYGNRLEANAKKKERDFKYNEQFRERQLNRALNEAMQDPEIVGRTRTGIPGVHGRPIASSSSLERIRRAEENYSELRKKLYAESENEEKALAEAKNKASAFNDKRGDRVERARKTLERLRQGRVNQAASTASSLTKMPAGQKGMESGAYGRKLKTQAKEVAEKNRAAMARANAKYDRNRNARLEQMGNLMAKASVFPDYSALASMYRNAYEKLAREDQREGRATAATTNALNQEIYDLEGKAARHESHRGEVASRAQRALERYRKSREAERGGASAPQQSAPHATKLGRMQPGSTAVNAGKEAKRLDHNARVYHRTARRAREAYNAKMDKAIAEQEALRQKAIGKLNSNALGVRAYAESHSRAETPEQATHKAAQYIKLGNKYRDKYRGMKESAENKQNEIERKKNDYKMKSYENVSRRDQEADNAKERLARMRKLAKALKARRPGSFKG